MQARRIYRWHFGPLSPDAADAVVAAAVLVEAEFPWYQNLQALTGPCPSITVTVYGRDRWNAARRAGIFIDAVSRCGGIDPPDPQIQRPPAHNNRGHRRGAVTPAV